jgi:MYXO-CTERM domain-containing protein
MWWDDTGCGANMAYMCERPDTTPISCGNGVVSAAEGCDDGGNVSGDGCSASCAIEPGYFCSRSGGVCTAVCSALGNSFSRFPVPAPASAMLPATTLANEVVNEANAASIEYVRCGTTTLNAFHANQACQSFGAGWTLVDINSSYENSLIAGQLSSGAWWMGATDEENPSLGGAEETGFRWRDTAPVGFTAWITAPIVQPDDGAGATHDPANTNSHGQDCATVAAGTGTVTNNWDDLQCAERMRFVCEGPAFCGNAAVAMPEQCDRGTLNGALNSGCTASCTIPSGYGCLLPGGNGDPADVPPFAFCPRSANGSCCYLSAQAVVGDVRIVGGELEWSTLSEAGTTGFQVSALRRGQWVELHEGVLPALPDAAQGAVYRLHASGLRTATIRIVEHEAGAPGLTVYEGTPRTTAGAATLTDSNYSVVANATTGPADMASDAAPSPAARRKAAGDEPTGVFALAAEEGLMRVTFAEIAEALRLPVETVATSVAAGSLSITSYGTPVAWTQVDGAEDAIAFTARRRTSVYGGTRPYELRLTTGVELGEVDRSLADVATGTATQRIVHDVDVFPALAVSPDPTEEFWFQASLGNHNSFRDYNTTVVLNDVDGEAATFDLAYYAAPGLTAESPLTLTMTLNGQPGEVHEVTTTGLGVVTFALPAGSLLPGPNTVRIRATSAAPAGTALVYVDRYTVTFGAPLEFSDAGRFQALENGALAFELDAATGTPTFLVDATLDRVITATRTDIDGTRARFTFDAQAGHEYFVATEGGLNAPTALRARSEQNFADSSRAADYVVIAPAALYDAATALAARRQTQGLTTAVVDVQDIYDAFGHGDHDPYAIREFLRVAHTNWATAPRYVLLLGDGNYDYRSVRATGSGSIPPMLIRTERGVYASDMQLGDVTGDGRADMAIGRVPAHTAPEADAFVQRVVTYESGDLDVFARHALLVSGTNRGEDFTRYVDSLAGQLDERVNAERIDRAALTLADARTQLIGAINDGSFWFHYQGHGASNQLDDDGLLTLADVAGLSNGNALTIFSGMSCSTSRFEVPGMDSISELMLSGSPGGAIALYGPSGPGYSYESGNIAEAFQRHLLTGDNLAQGRMGDVVLGLWATTGGANASREQLSIYLLLGDPATVLPDRTDLAPPPVVDPPDQDGGVTEPMVDGGRADLGRDDAGRPITPGPGPVTPPGGALGGGACTVSAGNATDATGGLLLLLGVLAGLGRRARRRAR